VAINMAAEFPFLSSCHFVFASTNGFTRAQLDSRTICHNILWQLSRAVFPVPVLFLDFFREIELSKLRTQRHTQAKLLYQKK